MTSMLGIVLGNLFRRARSRTPGDIAPVPATFRGALAHDAARCTACGTCAYVCAPKAISFAQDPGVSVTWQFFIGRCSFCGLCQQNCPTGAISSAAAPPATTNNALGDGLRLQSVIRLQPCSRCGTPHIPLPGAGDECPECRRWRASARLHDAFLGGEETHG